MSHSAGQLSLWPDIPGPVAEPARIRSIKGRPGFIPTDREFTHFVPLVLASGSPSKIDILKRLGLLFTVDPADIDETAVSMETPEQMVKELADRKASATAGRHAKALVVGADTVIVLGDRILGKPQDRSCAREMLQELSDRTHVVSSGLVVLDVRSGEKTVRLARTLVKFRRLSRQTITRYLQTREPMGKAGAYGLQGIGSLLIERIEGEYSNVLGLPIATFVDALADLGYELI